MMMISRPYSSLYLRHLDRSSATVMAGVSSMISRLSPMLTALSMTSVHSASDRSPVRIFWASTWDCMAKRRLTSCSLDISREKMATQRFSRMVMYSAILRTRAVLPMEGRAATRIKSAGWRPAVRLSRSVKPVDRPVTLPWMREACSILSMALRTIWRMGTKLEAVLLWEISKILFSALSSRASISSLSA